jgi:signal transduction histidine kinase
MKLFAKYNRINVLSTIIIFLLGSIAFTFLLRYVIIRQIDEDLNIEKNEIITAVRNFHHLPAIIEVHDQYTTYKAIAPPQHPISRIHTGRNYNAAEREQKLVRTIEFHVNTNGGWYLVSVSKSLEGTDNLIRTIIFITLTLILLILIATFIINRIVLRRLWQPFYNTLHTVQQFKLSNTQKLHFTNSNIEEFELLNTTLSKSIGKAQQDYQSLKEFTENASHELQTPLAVIHSKLDILIQNEQLSEQESGAIQGAYQAVQNLSRLNQSLLLLAKIENKQFEESVAIQLDKVLEDKIAQFDELWQSKNISFKTALSTATIHINPTLLDILLNNLLGNATQHNVTNGFIELNLQQHNLQISNTGQPCSLDENQIYNRFYKGNHTTGKHGLGLSIIRQICDVSGFTCNYHFKSPATHSFTVQW